MTVSIGMFSEECKKRKVVTGMILNYCGNQQPQLNDCSVFNLVLQFIHQVDDHCYNNFKSFSASKLTVDVLESIAEATKSQADSKLWHSMRQGRVTGSKIYEAIHCKTENGALVQSILGGYKVPETKAIRRGKVLEKEVVKELEKEFGAIQHTGLILISPIIGVSPDGICSDFVIEIKCPISENTIKNYVRDGILCEKYKAQIMVQMHAAKKLKGLFCIADPTFEQTKLLHKYWVDYDKKYVTGLLDGAEEFWKQFIFKTVLQSAK